MQNYKTNNWFGLVVLFLGLLAATYANGQTSGVTSTAKAKEPQLIRMQPSGVTHVDGGPMALYHVVQTQPDESFGTTGPRATFRVQFLNKLRDITHQMVVQMQDEMYQKGLELLLVEDQGAVIALPTAGLDDCKVLAAAEQAALVINHFRGNNERKLVMEVAVRRDGDGNNAGMTCGKNPGI